MPEWRRHAAGVTGKIALRAMAWRALKLYGGARQQQAVCLPAMDMRIAERDCFLKKKAISMVIIYCLRAF